MTIKERLTELLSRSGGEYISGEKAARELSVSRAAVWKAIRSLEGDGVEIESKKGLGYRLLSPCDLLSVPGIEKYLKCKASLELLSETDSTNTYAKERARLGAEHFHTVIAERQTCGRGRLGRSFYSPKGTGLYMTVILRPEGFTEERTRSLTTMAAVAVCEAIEAVCGKEAVIKWVNDVFADGKKVCGILTEASFSLEESRLQYAIVGIGVNILAPKDGFPPELSDIAGAVFETDTADARCRLCAEILNRFSFYLEKDDTSYADEYRKRCFVIGKRVTVHSLGSDEVKAATAIDVDDRCRLCVEYENGERELLSSGEISVRPI